ncbi:hypothetical protein NL108_005387 [Boleophthalmus pectinirostris]|uniref:C-type lectin domain family 10 member A-like n=1 Tax=Boleophthalmus pectinirostris TaxID=150288 RepID=UPI00242CC145|nr:C-type lectin domain family 10 member A-like [Boleophthalmus pectinirostris]KAJ0055546.1 hypothetical protein NL108_005387 [Boleophthalmus pectinirostris]
MSTQFRDEPDEDDVSNSYWNKDPGPIRYSAFFIYRKWLVSGLVSVFILILIIAFGVSNAGLASRLGLMEETVSNLSVSLTSSQKESKDTAKSVQRLRFNVESNKDNLNSVAESLQQLSALDSLTKTVASVKCTLNQLLNNGTIGSGCCPLEWDRFESSCYLFSKESKTWHDARDWCHAHQSQLLIISTDKEWDYLTNHLSGTFYWVGLTDENGKWEWANGTPYTMDRRRWKPGQPDNWTGHGLGEGTEDCAHLHWDGRLNDLHCSSRLKFICHRHSTQT